MNRSRIWRMLLAAVAGVLAAGTTHVVVKGDTLWDITGKYLGNPFLWPSVWQKNPQIKNAHWIYPGDSVLVDGSKASTTPAAVHVDSGKGQSGLREMDAVQPSAPGIQDPLAGFPTNPDNNKYAVIDTTEAALDLVIPPSQSVLNLEKVINAPVLYPVDEPLPSLQSELVFDEEYGLHQLLPGGVIGAKFGSDNGVKLGDRMVLIEHNDKVATMVVPSTKGRLEEIRGLAEVIEVHKRTALCRLVSVYGVIGFTAKIRPLVMPTADLITAFEAVNDPVPAAVIVNNRVGRTQMIGSAVIIDRGESQGIHQGDIYEFMDEITERGLGAMRGYGLVVRTTRTSATIMIVGATSKPIKLGDKAWRVRRSVRS